MSSQLPDVLKVGALKRPVNQVCSTDLLQPTTFSQTFCKFVLDKKGILDSNSQLNISQVVVNSDRPTTDTKSFYPTATGALALISRAYLTIGGREVSDLRDCGHFNTWRRLHYSNEYRKGVAMPHQSGNDVYVGSAGSVINPYTTTASAKRQRGFDNPAGTIGRESSEYANNYNVSAPAFNQLGNQVPSYTNQEDKPKRLIPFEASRTPSQLIALSQLFPVLIDFQLPLAFIEGEVALNLEFSPDTWGHRFMFNRFDASNAANNKDNLKSTIIEADTFLVMDTLFYPDLMGDIQEQIYSRGGYSVPYDDVITQRNYLQYSESEGITQKDLQIPLAQKRVKRIVVQKSHDLVGVVQSQPCGYYNSQALRTGEEYNFRVDSKNVYSMPLKNVALQRAEADLTEGIPLVENSAIYSFFNQADQATGQIATNNDYNLTRRLCNSHIQSNEAGIQFWKGLKLENAFGQGHLMGIQPVIYTEKAKLTQYDDGTGTTPNRQASRDVRFFCYYQRILNINNGLAEVID
jgi:hypothetical protein